MHDNNTFIDKLSKQLYNWYKDDVDKLTIVLPNRRAKVFLEAALKNHCEATLFSPRILSIEDLLFDITQIQSIDSIELLFEFYEVYTSVTPKEAIQDFEKFSSWAMTLLQDFNEIDRYLLDPKHVLSYLKDIEDLKEDVKHWSQEKENQTPLVSNYLAFYGRLETYHSTLYQRLLKQKKGYQGLIYREAIDLLEAYAKENKQPIVFAGFNALNAAEEIIFQHFSIHNEAQIFWDIDKVFFEDTYHEAGYFARRIKSSWKYYKNNDFNGLIDVFSASKNISIIGTPKSVGQAKIAGSILDKVPVDKLSNTAVVLGDENLLEPVLYSLPNSINKVNITMGLSAKNNPVQIFFNKVFRLHSNALNRLSYVFYYKDLLDVLSHPVIANLLDVGPLLKTIKQRNITFITADRLFELDDNSGDGLFELLFQPWENEAGNTIDKLIAITQEVKQSLENSDGDNQLTKVFLYTIYTVFIKLKNYFIRYPEVSNVPLLFSLYKQLVQLAEVSFEGEPLGGLQIMGVLESRTLDFENIIITSLNEGTLPAGKSTQSFIPYDVKLELGLPTYKEKDAIYTYHFYHMISRAKNVYLLYNTESEGLDAGEKSRFITQLEIEKQSNHNTTHEIYTPHLPAMPYTPVSIPKSESVRVRLQEIANKGFSPSSLTSYLRDPLQFYYQRVLRISETDEVEENIAANTLGTIIHETLKELYEPYLNKFLSESDVAQMKKEVDDRVQKQFAIVYEEGDIQHGKNLLAYEVAKRNINNLLKLEEKWLKEGDAVKVLELEQKFNRVLSHPSLPFDVTIAGEVDRIEERNGKIRIIDYKSGKVDPLKLRLKKWDNLLAIEYDKVIQLLAYSYMYFGNVGEKELEAGIISFKNMSKGFMPYSYDKSTTIDSEVLDLYEGKIVDLLLEILDEFIPFTEVIR